MPLALGDALFNLRSALDHAVYELSMRIQTPPAPHVPEFVIRTGNFTPRDQKKISALSSAAQQIVKAAAPTGSAILHLHDLNIIDKHRLLITTAYAATHTTVIGGDPAARQTADHFKALGSDDPIMQMALRDGVQLDPSPLVKLVPGAIIARVEKPLFPGVHASTRFIQPGLYIDEPLVSQQPLSIRGFLTGAISAVTEILDRLDATT